MDMIFNYDTVDEFMPKKDIKKYVLSQYKLKIYDIELIKFKNTDKQRVVYKVHTDKGDKCLKKVYFDKHTLLFIYSAIEWLNMKGIKCPRLLPTKTGMRFSEYKEHIFILTDWIEGQKCSYDNINDILVSASNLAKIHSSSRGFKPILGSFTRVSKTNYLESYLKHFKHLTDMSNKAFIMKDSFSKHFIEIFEKNIYKARKSIELLSSIRFDSTFGDAVSLSSICHLDYVNKNLIFSENGLYVIDFDNTKIDLPVHDLVYFFKRILRRKNTLWDFSIFLKALKEYEKIRPLSFNEHIFILSTLQFPHRFWKVSRDYYKYGYKNPTDNFIETLKNISSQEEAHSKFCIDYNNYILKTFKNNSK